MKIAAFRQRGLGRQQFLGQSGLLAQQADECVARARVTLAARLGAGPLDLVAARQGFDRRAVIGQPAQQRREIVEPFGDDMDDALLVLQLTGDADQPRAEHDRAKGLECLRPDDGVGDAGLVFQRHEDDAVGAARPLADEDDAGNGDSAAR